MLSDAELDRMVKNLKTAFAQVSDSYERLQNYYGSGLFNANGGRESSMALATISAAYLQAASEKQRREEDKPADLGKAAAIKLPHPGQPPL